MQVHRYAERIDHVLEYLEARDAGESAASLSEVAAVAAISPHHFHRVFRLMTGETLLECQTRIRLARSLPAMRNPEATIATAAMSAGYATSQSYTRALKSFAGVSGSELRSDPAKLAALEERLTRCPHRPGGCLPPLDVRVVALEPLELIALRNVGAYEGLFESYERLASLILSQADGVVIRGIYGLHLDDVRSIAPEALRFDCAFEVEGVAKPAAGTVRLAPRPGPCLATRHTGDYTSLLDTIDALYAEAIDRDFELGDAPLLAHYLDDPADTAASALRTELYLPIAGGGKASGDGR